MKRQLTYSTLRGVVVLAFLVLLGRLWYMQIVEVKAYRATGTERHTTERTVQAPRGIIYDSKGRPLTRNLPELEVSVTPALWHSYSRAESVLLSRLLHGHPSAARIRWLIYTATYKSGLPETHPVSIKKPVGYRTFLRLEANSNRLPGVVTASALDHRLYLDSAPYSLSHILGYVTPISGSQYAADTRRKGQWTYQRYTDTDLAGQSGLEAYFDHQLHGINGIQAATIDAAGDQVSPWHTVHKTVPGDGLRLTINSKFQQQVASDVQQAMVKNGWKYGSAVALNPWNGHVLAMVSLPSFNANPMASPSASVRTRTYDHLLKDALRPLVDNSVDGTYPPGSIYKVVTATAGLASGVITPTTIVDDTGQIQRTPGGPIFHGWYGPGLGPVDVIHAIAESSDIFFYQVAGGGPNISGDGVGPKVLGRWAHRYGLGRHSGIELPDATGVVPSQAELEQTQHRPWSYGDSYNMGIGQGDNLVTPLQMARVASVIANGGNLIRPTLVQGLTGPNGKHFLPGKDFGAVPDVVRAHFVPSWITHLIGSGMRLGVTMHGVYPAWGTSYGQVDQRTQAAGKTGTAQTFEPGTCKTLSRCVPTTDAWWMGFAPYNHPRIAVAVVFPYANSEGAFAAAPVASKIILDYEHKKSTPDWLAKVITKLDFYT